MKSTRKPMHYVLRVPSLAFSLWTLWDQRRRLWRALGHNSFVVVMAIASFVALVWFLYWVATWPPFSF